MADSRDKPELETLTYRPDGDGCNPEQPKGKHSPSCASLNHPYAECTCCPEQPNKNLMIIEEIEGLMSQVNDKLIELPDMPKIMRCQLSIKSLALEEIDLFQKTTLFELRKAFE